MLLFQVSLPLWLTDRLRGLSLVVVLVAVALIGLALGRERVVALLYRTAAGLPELFQAGILQRLQAGLESLAIVNRRRDSFWVAFWSLLIWGSAILTNVFVMRALQIEAPFASAVVALLLLQAVITLAPVPGSVGVFEYLGVVALSLFAIDESRALGFGLLLHVLVLLPPLAGLYLFRSAQRTIVEVSEPDATTGRP